MAKLVRRIDNLGRIVIPKEIRDNMGLYEGCECSITPTENGVIIGKSEKNLKNDLKFLIDKYIADEGYSDSVMKLMEVQEEIQREEHSVA